MSDVVPFPLPEPVGLRALFPEYDSVHGEPLSLRTLLDRAPPISGLQEAPLTVLGQNVALLPGVTLRPDDFPSDLPPRFVPEARRTFVYKGVDRPAAVSALVEQLRRALPDVAGLSEVFAVGPQDTERRLVSRLGDVYPHHLHGPEDAAPRPNGALLLLSRHPIVDQHQTVFRQAMGDDALISKGALHARIRPAGHPVDYDVFLAHLQSQEPALPGLSVGPGVTAWEKVQRQLTHLGAFVAAYRDPGRPALLIGDLNVDGLNDAQYRELRRSLAFDDDLWPMVNRRRPDDPAGLTMDEVRSFNRDRSPLDEDDVRRRRRGERLDYLLGWRSTAMWPLFDGVDVVNWQSEPQRDLSDHYGLLARHTKVRELAAPPDRPINAVTLRLTQVRCLSETAGPVELLSRPSGSDEVELELRAAPSGGPQITSRHRARLDGFNSGEVRAVSGVDLRIEGDPGQRLTVEVMGWEIDVAPVGVETGRTELGPGEKDLSRVDLLSIPPNGRTYVPTLLHGSGGEYASYVEVRLQ